MPKPIEASSSKILLLDTAFNDFHYETILSRSDPKIISLAIAWITDFQTPNPFVFENVSDKLKISALKLKELYVIPPPYVSNVTIFRAIFSERIAKKFSEYLQPTKRKETESSQSSSSIVPKRQRKTLPDWETAVQILSQANQKWVNLLQIPKVKEAVQQDLAKIEKLSQYTSTELKRIATYHELLEFLPESTLEVLTKQNFLVDVGYVFLPLFKTRSFTWNDFSEILLIDNMQLQGCLLNPIICFLLQNKHLDYTEAMLQAYKIAAEELCGEIEAKLANFKNRNLKDRLNPLLDAIRAEADPRTLEDLLAQIREADPRKRVTASVGKIAFEKRFCQCLTERLRRLVTIFARPTMKYFLENRLVTLKVAEELQDYHFNFLNYLRISSRASALQISDGNIADLVVWGLTTVENLKNFTLQQLQDFERIWQRGGIIRELVLAKALTVNDVVQLTDAQVATIQSVINPSRFLEHVPKELLLSLTRAQADRLGEPLLRRICLDSRFGISFAEGLEIPECYFQEIKQKEMYALLDSPEAAANYFKSSSHQIQQLRCDQCLPNGV